MRIEQKLIIPLILISSGNLITGIHRGYSALYFFAYVGVFVLILIGTRFIPKKNNERIISLIILGISLLTVWFGDYTDLISITLFCFSLFIGCTKKKHLYIYGSILAICVMARFTFTGLTVSQMGVFLGGSSVILIVYFHYIHPKQPQESYPDFNDDHSEIMQGLRDGKSPKEIADKMCLSASTIRDKEKVMRDMTGTKTNLQLLDYLWANGYIRK